MADNQTDFEKILVNEYFKYGSINRVFSAHHFDLPISFAGYTRVLSKYGVIKSAGPNSNLSESLHILSQIASYKIPLERIYHALTPKTIQVSINTLHRVLHYTRLGLTRRQGTALVITQKGNPDFFLTGHDLTLRDSALGQKGDISLPMSHSKLDENSIDSITRVLQQEVFTDLVLKQVFPFKVVPTHPKPIMFINIADIRVAVYHLELDQKYPFSSFKLKNIRFRDLSDISSVSVRPGVKEILTKYLELSDSTNYSLTPELKSDLNTSLYALSPLISETK